MRTRIRLAVFVAFVTLLVACSDEQEARIETATVTSGEVVQTVAAPARLQPRAQARVTSPADGEITELRVTDGDRVEAGDVLVRIDSATLDAQVEQATAAVEAAESVAADSLTAGVEIAPVVGSFRTQLDAVVPGILDAMRATISTSESSLQAAIDTVTATSRAAEAWSAALEEAVVEGADTVEELRGIGRRLEEAIDDEAFERAVVDGIEVPHDVALPGLDVPDGALPDLDVPDGEGATVPELPDPSRVVASLVEAQHDLQEARAALRRTELGFAEAAQQLTENEAELEKQARRSEDARLLAAEAQVEQAQTVLEAAEARSDGLTVTAPIDGVVELSRGGDAGADPADLLEGLGDGVAGLSAGAGEASLPDRSPLGAAGSESDGVVAEGAAVRAGQPLLTIHDTSRFRAVVEVDEIDVVDVVDGQRAEVIIDAFPATALDGVVERVAFSPSQDATGASLYEVDVRLFELPAEIRPRAGLTASAEIDVRRVDAELVVPTSALLRRADGEVVHVVRDGVVEEIGVRLEAVGDEDAAVDGDLRPGEEVVTIGVELVADGDELPR